MQALAAVVSCSGNKKYTFVIAEPDRPRQHAVGLAFRSQLAPADVDEGRPGPHRLFNRLRQVELG